MLAVVLWKGDVVGWVRTDVLSMCFVAWGDLRQKELARPGMHRLVSCRMDPVRA